jgi:hypothetical protein
MTMNMIDVLKKLAAGDTGDIEVYTDDPFVYSEVKPSNDLVAALTDAIEQLEWVPVTARTPDNDDKVIVYVPDYSIKVSRGVTDNFFGYAAVGHYLDGKWHQPHVGYPGPVTMWKPWPKEPEGKTSTQQMLDEVIDHIMEV